MRLSSSIQQIPVFASGSSPFCSSPFVYATDSPAPVVPEPSPMLLTSASSWLACRRSVFPVPGSPSRSMCIRSLANSCSATACLASSKPRRLGAISLVMSSWTFFA